ncbi:MAG: class I SAM-dependent methyltransferase [Candidatus Eremiobacteraeota bacterium]|nr:class I SAM-dependent methyltransferase [Candidatus Eremiobacteraeota bacterium]MBV8366409.1 class I SAM-dependent methyltransferase [Candidatus Eremiobacteraeota bacterium]
MAVDIQPVATQPNAFDELIRAVGEKREQPRPWVDVGTYPWSEEDFSSRYVRRANYQQLYDMQETGDDVEDILGHLKPAAKARLLDLCAGNGRHAIAMALRGYKLTGIDIGPGAVSLARDTARNLGLGIDFRQLDVLHISFEDAFDGAYLSCAGISDFSPEDARTMLQLVERALVPGGAFVGEYAEATSAPAQRRAWQFVQAESSLFLDVPHLQLDERSFDAQSGAEVERAYVVPTDGRTRAFTRCRQYYTESAIRDLLESARFEVAALAPGSAPGLRRVVAKKT